MPEPSPIEKYCCLYRPVPIIRCFHHSHNPPPPPHTPMSCFARQRLFLRQVQPWPRRSYSDDFFPCGHYGHNGPLSRGLQQTSSHWLLSIQFNHVTPQFPPPGKMIAPFPGLASVSVRVQSTRGHVCSKPSY